MRSCFSTFQVFTHACPPPWEEHFSKPVCKLALQDVNMSFGCVCAIVRDLHFTMHVLPLDMLYQETCIAHSAYMAMWRVCAILRDCTAQCVCGHWICVISSLLGNLNYKISVLYGHWMCVCVTRKLYFKIWYCHCIMLCVWGQVMCVCYI